MTRYGYVIRTGGDAEIAGALMAGVERGTKGGRPLSSAASPLPPSPKGEGRRGRPGSRGNGPEAAEALRRCAMRRHTPEELEAMIVKARYDYGQDPEPGRVARALCVGYALICYGLNRLFHRQDALLGLEGRRTE